MSDIVVEKFSKQMMSAYGYDFKILYFPESDNCMVPYKATPDASAYNLYAAENEDILPKSNSIISLHLRWAIPKGFFGNFFSRSGLF